MASFLDILKANQELAAPHLAAGFARDVQTLPGRMDKWVDSWPNGQGHDDVIRCSGLYYMCPREFVLNYWKPKANSDFDFASYLRMGVGTYLHSFLQDVVLGVSGVLYGNWRDVVSNKVVRGFMPDPEKQLAAFREQRTLPFAYVEDKVWNPHYRLRGHTDGLVHKGRLSEFCERVKAGEGWLQVLEAVLKVTGDPDDLALLEIKTTSARILQGIEGPKDIADYYKMQAIAYQHLTGVKSTIFWYFERGDLSSKTLLFDYSESWWDEIAMKINTVWTSIRDHTLPDSFMKCMSSTSTRAKKCVQAGDCWKPPIGPKDMEKFIQDCKQAQPTRQWLDLTDWK